MYKDYVIGAPKNYSDFPHKMSVNSTLKLYKLYTHNKHFSCKYINRLALFINNNNRFNELGMNILHFYQLCYISWVVG